MTISTEEKIIATAGRLALVNSTHEADTKLLLHGADVAADGLERVMIRTVDTDVLILSVLYSRRPISPNCGCYSVWAE